MSAEQKDLVELAEWEDEDENGGEWPYPDRWTRSQITGELAARCRLALGITDSSVEVTITEHVESGGYSEYTQEDYQDFTIAAGEQSVEFYGNAFDSTFVQLLKWLDARPA